MNVMAKRRVSPIARRVLLGVVLAIAFVIAVWRAWGMDAHTLFEYFTGSIVLVLVMAVPAFMVVAIIRLLRARR